MAEYVISYNSREVNIRLLDVDVQFCKSEMINMYKSALMRYSGKTYGDEVPWNNQNWIVIEAHNPVEALLKAVDYKTPEQIKKRNPDCAGLGYEPCETCEYSCPYR